MSSKIFTTAIRSKIESNVLQALNNLAIGEKWALQSPRAVGDCVQAYLEDHLLDCIPNGNVGDFNASFARRAMADFAFHDVTGNYYVVDSKTHCLDTVFNMPNLTSVQRLARFYEDKTNYFCILLNNYQVSSDKLRFVKCCFVPIEMLDWSCLTIGALGWGQIQIANANKVKINTKVTRKEWMLRLCDMLDVFYPSEIGKIKERQSYFKKVRSFWEAQ